jgi:hypothetical protein
MSEDPDFRVKVNRLAESLLAQKITKTKMDAVIMAEDMLRIDAAKVKDNELSFDPDAEEDKEAEADPNFKNKILGEIRHIEYEKNEAGSEYLVEGQNSFNSTDKTSEDEEAKELSKELKLIKSERDDPEDVELEEELETPKLYAKEKKIAETEVQKDDILEKIMDMELKENDERTAKGELKDPNVLRNEQLIDEKVIKKLEKKPLTVAELLMEEFDQIERNNK